MANIASARKRARQTIWRNRQNSSMRAMMRTRIRKLRRAIQLGDQEAARNAYRQLVPVVDRLCSKRLIHKNRAARYKSRLNRQVRALHSS